MAKEEEKKAPIQDKGKGKAEDAKPANGEKGEKAMSHSAGGVVASWDGVSLVESSGRVKTACMETLRERLPARMPRSLA